MPPSDRSQAVAQALLTYGFDPQAAQSMAQTIEIEYGQRNSPDPDLRAQQSDFDAYRAESRAREKVESFQKWANNPENFRIPLVSTAGEGVAKLVQPLDMVSRAQAQARADNERLSGVKMLRDYMFAQDAQRAEEMRKEQLWAETWGHLNAPLVDERGMILPNTGGPGGPSQAFTGTYAPTRLPGSGTQ